MKIIIKTLILGILTAIFAVIAEQLLAAGAQYFFNQEIILSFYDRITWFLAAAVIIEEGSKYSVLRYAIHDRLNIRGKKFVTSSLFFGLLFGLAEIGLIIFSNPEAKILARSFDREMIIGLSSIALIQTATALLIGALIATQKEKMRLAFLRILVFPILIHFLYNFLVIQKGAYTDFLVLATLVISYLVSLAIIAFNWRGLAR